MKLYKYIGHQDDNELLNIIENIFKDNTLKVTNPKDFNDPFDCNMEVIRYYNDFLNRIYSIPNCAPEILAHNFQNYSSLTTIAIPKGTTSKFIRCGLSEYQHLLVEKDI